MGGGKWKSLGITPKPSNKDEPLGGERGGGEVGELTRTQEGRIIRIPGRKENFKNKLCHAKRYKQLCCSQATERLTVTLNKI